MAETIIAGDYSKVLNDLLLNPSDSIVIAHGEPEHDYVALKSLIDKDAAYVGLLGSKTKAAILTQKLQAEGVSEKKTKLLHAPLGLSIGAQTPEEIGISILAEIIQCRRKR